MQLPIDTLHKVHLTEEKATLLITLYAKALDNRAKNPILGDKAADEIVSSIDYDFQKFQFLISNGLTMLRARQFDDWIHEFIAHNHDAIVLNLGCGLDTRIIRINPLSEVSWYDLDYPEVIELREKFFTKRDGYFTLASSVTDPQWLENIPTDRPVMIVAEGIFPYLTENQVQILLNRLTSHFHHGQIAFDTINSVAVKMAGAQMKKNTGAIFKWVVEDIRTVGKLDPKLRMIANRSVAEVPSVKKLSWKNRIWYIMMQIIPRRRNFMRLLRYQF